MDVTAVNFPECLPYCGVPGLKTTPDSSKSIDTKQLVEMSLSMKGRHFVSIDFELSGVVFKPGTPQSRPQTVQERYVEAKGV
jgi:poly(A)-specific ribonuclease